MLHAPASYRQYAAGLAIALCCSNPAAGASQEQIAREMIQVLEAYAVYKMGDFDEAYSRYLTLAEAGNRQPARHAECRQYARGGPGGATKP